MEKARTEDLIRLLPKNRRSVLDIGARDGHFSRLMTEIFSEVTALDLQKPSFTIPGVETVAGDVTALAFPNESFDCVFCAEVLEHVPDIDRACQEMIRVARHEIVIGVPFQQDTRVGRTTCRSCGKRNPPWGHINIFDESRLKSLFTGLQVVSTSLVGQTKGVTNSLAALLMDISGNPWGTYDQDEPCIYCGSPLMPPKQRSTGQKLCSSLAFRMNQLQEMVSPYQAGWLHMVFSKK